MSYSKDSTIEKLYVTPSKLEREGKMMGASSLAWIRKEVGIGYLVLNTHLLR